jgi:hypothetical protein
MDATVSHLEHIDVAGEDGGGIERIWKPSFCCMWKMASEAR